MCRGAYLPYFKINASIFFSHLFFEEYLNLEVRINKMVNKHTVNYHPSPLQLISRIYSLILLCIPKWFISPVFFMLRLLTNAFASQKIESVYFYSWQQEKPSPRFLSLPLKQKEFAYSSRTGFSEDLIFPSRKGEEDYEFEKLSKSTFITWDYI